MELKLVRGLEVTADRSQFDLFSATLDLLRRGHPRNVAQFVFCKVFSWETVTTLPPSAFGKIVSIFMSLRS